MDRSREDSKAIGPIRQADLDLTISDLLTDDLKWNTSRIKEVLPEFLPQISEGGRGLLYLACYLLGSILHKIRVLHGLHLL